MLIRLLESTHIDDIPVDILYPDACRLIAGCGDSSYLTLTVPTDTQSVEAPIIDKDGFEYYALL